MAEIRLATTSSSMAENRRSVATALLVASALAAVPLSAGSLAVNAAAAQGGTLGLEVALGGPCSPPNELVIEPPGFLNVSGSFTACSNLSASGVQVIGAGATFTAGRSISIGNDFSVAADAAFSAVVDESLDPFAFVSDTSPSDLRDYTAIYDIDLDNLAFTAGDELDNLTGFAADGTMLFRVVLLRSVSPPENRLELHVRLDDGSTEVTPFGEQLLIPPGSSAVEIGWRANNGMGHLLASINGASLLGLTGLDNGDKRLDSVSWGAVSGTVASTTGSLALDEFASFGSAEDSAPGVRISSTLDGIAEGSQPEYSASTGAQTGRLSRNVAFSDCGSVKPNPGVFSATGARQYDEYRFVAIRSGCVTVTLSSAGNNVLFSAAYDQLGMNPASPSLNYLADAGASPTTATPSRSYSFDVDAGEVFNVVVHEVNPGGGAGQSYILEVEGVKLIPDFAVSSDLDTVSPGPSPAYLLSATGNQTGRLSRNGVISQCGAPKANPGLFTATGARRTDVYRFLPGGTGCALVSLAHSGAHQAHVVVYDEGGYNPTNPALNYLADVGSSAANNTRVFSFAVTAGVPFDLAIHEVNPGAGVGDSYTLSISNVSLIPTVKVPRTLGGAPSPPQPEFTWVSGSQTGRLTRNGVPSQCGILKPNPGLFSPAGSRQYETFTFTPSSSGCVQATLRGSTSFFAIAYNLSGFVPGNPSLNYLADSGLSPTPGSPATLSFGVTGGVPFTVVVHEVNSGVGLGEDFTLEVGGVALGSGFELPLFEDGFESGNTSAWSSAVP